MGGDRQKLAHAMRSPDQFVCDIVYEDRWGERTKRAISPIRFVGTKMVLALCVGREEPRIFDINNMHEVTLRSANSVLMPEPVTKHTETV